MFFQSHTLRQALTTGYRAYARSLFFLGSRRIFINSIPKAGTHLLTTIFSQLPRTMLSGIHIDPWDCHRVPRRRGGVEDFDLDPERFVGHLRTVHPGQILTGHFPWRDNIVGPLEDHNVATIFMLRDPRDVLVSELKYISQLERHHLHKRLMTEFEDDNARLMALIRGVPPRSADEPAPMQPVGLRLGHRVGWLKMPGCHVTRFEDLIGARDGGDPKVQLNEILSIAEHIARPLTTKQAKALIDATAKRKSFTFRRGAIGDWVSHFNDKHREAFDAEAADALKAFGYAPSREA